MRTFAAPVSKELQSTAIPTLLDAKVDADYFKYVDPTLTARSPATTLQIE